MLHGNLGEEEIDHVDVSCHACFMQRHDTTFSCRVHIFASPNSSRDLQPSLQGHGVWHALRYAIPTLSSHQPHFLVNNTL